MKQAHYSEVPRNEDPNTLTEIREIRKGIRPLDLEGRHNKANKLDNFTLKAKFLVPIIFIFFTFPFAVLMLLLSFARKPGYVQDTIGVLETISYISQSNPVVDIQPITGSQVCGDLDYEPGGFGEWKGLAPGCYCNSTSTLTAGSCSVSQLDDCENVDRRPNVETFTWNGDRFCMRRLYDFVRTAGGCPSGYTQCGTKFCTPSSEPCPITDVQILPVSTATPAGYTARPLTFDKKLVFIRNSGVDDQFVQFSYSMQTPCLDSTAYSNRTTSNIHPLEIQKFFGCGKYAIDLESVALDQGDEIEYYTFNYIGSLVADVPLFPPVMTGSTIRLSARYRFKTTSNDVCVKYYFTDVSTFISDVEDFSALYRGITITGIILSTIACFIGLVYLRVLRRDGFRMVNYEEPFGRRFIVQIVCLFTLFFVTTAILGNNAFKKINKQEAYLKALEGANCFTAQPELNEALDDITHYLTNKIDYLATLNILLAIVSCGVTAFMFLNIIFRKRRNYERMDL